MATVRITKELTGVIIKNAKAKFDDAISKAVDAIVEKSMYGKKYLGPLRAAYLFDADGKLFGVIPKVEAAEHGKQLLAAIAEVR
jgi:peroxiredoxin Q/BCP